MTDVYNGLRNNHLGPPGGYFGNALVVDVTDGSTTTLALPERVLRDYLGGAGLGVWLMTELAPPGVDPLDPAAPLAFVFSPLVGTPLTTSAKFAVVAKSPLTGLLTDALASSHFAISGKFTGHDAIVLTGRAQAPAHLLIDADGVRLVDAAPQWGMSASDAEESLRAQHGRRWRAACIGPAGERGVRYATISHDGRHAGRGGLGAVMGAKNIKAVAVQGRTRPTVADREAVLAAAKDLRERSFGPATAKYRELGTLANLLGVQRDQHPAHPQLPVRHLRRGTHAVRRGSGAEPVGRQEQLRLLHHRLRAHLCRQGRQDGEGGVRERLRARADVRGIRS